MKTQMLEKNVERGQSLVELGMSLLFLLILLAGTIDLGRAFFKFIALRDAVEEGALYGSFCPWDVTHIIARVQNSQNNSWVIPDGIQISAADIVTTPNSDPGSAISVHAYVNFEMDMPLMGGRSFPIATTVTDTILKNADPCVKPAVTP